MNTPNNKRRKNSQEKIKKVFIELIQLKDINEISITDICKKSNINRSTFYANYIDIYDLVDKIRKEMFEDLLSLYQEEVIEKKHSYNYLKMFIHIKDNKLYYKTLFKLNLDFSNYYYDKEIENKEALKYYTDTKYLQYHKAFFTAGLVAIIKMWLENDCKESPEEINEILKNEYIKKATK